MHIIYTYILVLGSVVTFITRPIMSITFNYLYGNTYRFITVQLSRLVVKQLLTLPIRVYNIYNTYIIAPRSVRKIATGRTSNNAAHVVVNKSSDWLYYYYNDFRTGQHIITLGNRFTILYYGHQVAVYIYDHYHNTITVVHRHYNIPILYDSMRLNNS